MADKFDVKGITRNLRNEANHSELVSELRSLRAAQEAATKEARWQYSALRGRLTKLAAAIEALTRVESLRAFGESQAQRLERLGQNAPECPQCRERFAPSRADQKYCTKTCRDQSSRERRRAPPRAQARR